MEIMIILILICIFLFVSAYMFDWIENYFWEDDELFRKIMNYIKINQYKFEIKPCGKFEIEFGKIKVYNLISYRRLDYIVYVNNENINYLLNERQVKYICNYVYKIYKSNEKMKVLHEIM